MTSYAVISDIHANSVALRAVLNDIDRKDKEQDLQIDAIWCLGDTIVYGPAPDEALLDLIDRFSKGQLTHWIAGNNDYAVGRGYGPEATYGMLLSHANLAQEQGTVFSNERRASIMASHLWTMQKLGILQTTPAAQSQPAGPMANYVLAPEAVEGLARRFPALAGRPQVTLADVLTALPDRERAGSDVTLLHASPCEPVGLNGNYLRDDEDAEEAFLDQKTPLCFFGHTHHPVVYQQLDAKRISGNIQTTRPASTHRDRAETVMTVALDLSDGKKVLINPGSVGQPRDNDRRASYAIYNDNDQTVAFRRVPYRIDMLKQLFDINQIEQQMQSNQANFVLSPLAEPHTMVAHLMSRFEKADW